MTKKKSLINSFFKINLNSETLRKSEERADAFRRFWGGEREIFGGHGEKWRERFRRGR